MAKDFIEQPQIPDFHTREPWQSDDWFVQQEGWRGKAEAEAQADQARELPGS